MRPAPVDVCGASQREQRSSECHLMEVCLHRRLDAEGQPIRNPDGDAGDRPNMAHSDPRDHHNRGCQQRSLCKQDRLSRREQSVERRHQRNDRREVVAQQIETGALDVDDGWSKTRVPLDRLLEDRIIPGTQLEAAKTQERQCAVQHKKYGSQKQGNRSMRRPHGRFSRRQDVRQLSYRSMRFAPEVASNT